MILMRPAKKFDRYRNLMNCIDVSPEVKHQIIENCAKYSTIKKIRSRRYGVTAVIKRKTDDSVTI